MSTATDEADLSVVCASWMRCQMCMVKFGRKVDSSELFFFPRPLVPVEDFLWSPRELLRTVNFVPRPRWYILTNQISRWSLSRVFLPNMRLVFQTVAVFI